MQYDARQPRPGARTLATGISRAKRRWVMGVKRDLEEAGPFSALMSEAYTKGLEPSGLAIAEAKATG